MDQLLENKGGGELNEVLLRSLPYPAMYVRAKDREILAYNRQAQALGAKVGDPCWKVFGKFNFFDQNDTIGNDNSKHAITCSSCLGDKCMVESLKQSVTNYSIFGSVWDVHWMKISEDIFLHYIIDVSERANAEQLIRESDEKYRFLFTHNAQPMWILDLDSLRFIEVNDAAIIHYGYSKAEFESMTLSDIQLPDDLPILKKTIVSSKKKMGTTPLIRQKKKNGDIIYVNMVYNAMDFNGKRARHVLINDVTDRKLAEQALIDSELLFSEMAENTPGVIFQLYIRDDGKRGMHFVSPRIQDIFGVTAEALAKSWWTGEFSHPDDLVDFLKHLNAAIDYRKEFNYEGRALCPIGEVWIQIIARPILKEDELLFNGIIMDISKRKKTEEALRESELFLKRTQEIAQLGTYTMNIVSGKWTCSEVQNRILGIDAEYEKNFDSWISLLHPQWKQEITTYFQHEVLDKKSNFDKEYKIIRQNDQIERWLHGLGNVEYNANNEPIRMVGTVVDITQRKQLYEEHKFLLASVENTNNIVTVKDLDLKVVAANPAFLKLMGYASLGDVIGKTDAEIFSFYTDKSLIQNYMADERKAQTLKQGAYVLREEPIISLSGEESTIITKKYPIFDHDGNLFCTGSVSIDITDRKRNEQEILKLNQTLEHRVIERTAQLEEMNRELESFSYSVSHDLRAPLRHISGFSDLLANATQGLLSDKAKRYLDTINNSARNMGQLIDELLDFSRTGRVQLNRTSLNMNKLADDTRLLLEPSIGVRTIQWKISDLPTVSADLNLLRLVWMNLIENALKYSSKREESIVRIQSNENDDEYIFSVNDNGVGFDMKYVHKLFGVFQRLHTLAEFDGTGIGLANVRRIITKHGGRVWAEAELDKGATFYFTIPKVLISV